MPRPCVCNMIMSKKMWKHKPLSRTIVFATIFFATIIGHVVGLDDSEIVFSIKWPGKTTPAFLESHKNAETYTITTANSEKYKCYLPDTKRQDNDFTEGFQGVDPMDFLQPLFDQNTCSFRLETYWTYEVCHGQYVRQYHEEREGKKVKIQEYYLGTFDKDKHRAKREKENLYRDENQKSGPPMKKVEGVQTPYVEVEMTEGTVCDLNNKPRSIKLQYVCYEHGKHEILSFEETASCEYEAVVLSPLICGHPDYRARAMDQNDIFCTPLDEAPKKPRSLLALEAESFKFRHQKVTDGDNRVRVEIHPINVLDKHNSDATGNSLHNQGESPSDLSPVQSFLRGENCLNGGNGWWKYEFCYGRSVSQYHVESDGTRTTVNLGRFDEAKHIEWIEAHPDERPKPLPIRNKLTHFYGDGSVCEKTGKLRQTKVNLKCVEGQKSSSSKVSLILEEPATCQYILTVESPMICDIVHHADKNGLMTVLFASSNFDEPKSPVEPPFTKKDNDLDERIANDDD